MLQGIKSMHVVLSIGRMELEHQKFCLFNLFNFKLQNLGEMRGSVAQTIIEDEGAMESQRWFG